MFKSGNTPLPANNPLLSVRWNHHPVSTALSFPKWLLCVECDVKPYTLTHLTAQSCVFLVFFYRLRSLWFFKHWKVDYMIEQEMSVPMTRHQVLIICIYGCTSWFRKSGICHCTTAHHMKALMGCRKCQQLEADVSSNIVAQQPFNNDCKYIFTRTWLRYVRVFAIAIPSVWRL